jgi:hypothetical protein
MLASVSSYIYHNLRYLNKHKSIILTLFTLATLFREILLKGKAKYS